MKWKKQHNSLIVIAAGFVAISFLTKNHWFLLLSFVIMVGFLFPKFGELIHRSWMFFAKVLAYINSHILLSVIFFLFLTPISLLMRLLGKTQFVKKAPLQQSLFVTRNHLYNRQDLQNPF